MKVRPCIKFNPLTSVVVRNAEEPRRGLYPPELRWLFTHDKVPGEWRGAGSLLVVSIRRGHEGVYLGSVGVGIKFPIYRIRKDYII